MINKKKTILSLREIRIEIEREDMIHLQIVDFRTAGIDNYLRKSFLRFRTPAMPGTG